MSPAFHTILVSIQTGALMVAAFALLVSLIGYRRLSPQVLQGMHLTVGVGISIGFLIILGSILTGFAIWPSEAVLNSPLLKNKIFLSWWLVMIFGMFLVMHWGQKDKVWPGTGGWSHPALTSYYALLGLGGSLLIVVTNSIGGSVAGNPSGFEDLPRLLGIETRYTFYLPTWYNFALVGMGVIAAAVGIVVDRRSRRAEAKGGSR